MLEGFKIERSIYVVKRITQLFPVLLGVSIITFLIIHFIPGDPAEIMLGPRATPENVEKLTKQMGLDKSLLVQYGIFIKDALQGNMGTSIILKESVNTLVSERLPVTLFLVFYASILSLIISLPVAILSALKKDGFIDNSFRGLSIIGLSMPSFWIGILLMILLSIKIQLFPVSGYGEGFLGHLYFLFLPALTVSFMLIPVLVRPLRAKIISVLTSDYILAARARGLQGYKVLILHVLRNAVIGTITILGVNMGWMLGGSVVIETVFSVPGLGQLLINSILSRDYPIIQGLVLTFAVLVIIVNLITDLLYTVLDPRVDLE